MWQNRDQLRDQIRDDPFGGRRPTSHERMTGLPWDASYHDGPAPWDTGGPQPAIVRLVSEGAFARGASVLDAGCGTGDNALEIVRHSALNTTPVRLSVLGVDVAETALAMAREKAKALISSLPEDDGRRIEVEFAVADAFQLERLGRSFQTVLDCGLFHTFNGNSAGNSGGNSDGKDSDERARYVASLASVTEHDGTLYLLCFSDDGPETGPHPVSEEDLRAAFNPSAGWNIVSIDSERILTRYHEDGVPGWLATIRRG